MREKQRRLDGEVSKSDKSSNKKKELQSNKEPPKYEFSEESV